MGDIASPLVRFSTSAESFGSGGVNSSFEFGADCLDEPVFEEEDDIDNDVIGVEEDLLLRQRTRSSRSRHNTENNEFSTRESIVFEMSHQAQVEQIKRIGGKYILKPRFWSD